MSMAGKIIWAPTSAPTAGWPRVIVALARQAENRRSDRGAGRGNNPGQGKKGLNSTTAKSIVNGISNVASAAAELSPRI
jgi:hypothetical protein